MNTVSAPNLFEQDLVKIENKADAEKGLLTTKSIDLDINNIEDNPEAARDDVTNPPTAIGEEI